jgi:hypothetical protein
MLKIDDIKKEIEDFDEVEVIGPGHTPNICIYSDDYQDGPILSRYGVMSLVMRMVVKQKISFSIQEYIYNCVQDAKIFNSKKEIEHEEATTEAYEDYNYYSNNYYL